MNKSDTFSRQFLKQLIDQIMEDWNSKNTIGRTSPEELLKTAYRESKKFTGEGKFPPLDIQIYKPPNESIYKPDLPCFDDLPAMVKESLNNQRKAEFLQFMFTVPRGYSRRGSIASYLIDLERKF